MIWGILSSDVAFAARRSKRGAEGEAAVTPILTLQPDKATQQVQPAQGATDGLRMPWGGGDREPGPMVIEIAGNPRTLTPDEHMEPLRCPQIQRCIALLLPYTVCG